MEEVRCLICGSEERLPLLTLHPDAHRRLLPHTAKERVRFVVCRKCGFIYQVPRFTLHELKSIYVEEYRKDTIEADGVPKTHYLDFARTMSQREFEWIREQLPAGQGRRVLEVGCATGQLLRYFKDEGWQAIGVEPTRSFAGYGTRAHGLPILPVIFEEATLDAEFDLVILSQVLEHVEKPESVLTRAASLLRPGGRLYVSVPYYLTYLPIRPARELFISTHLYAFSPVSLANVARKCGLAMESVGTMSQYLSAVLRPEPAMPRTIEREDAIAVRRRVRRLALKYFLLHDSRFLLAEWGKRCLRAWLGEAGGERTIAKLRRLKHRLLMRQPA